ncbi:bacterio-opsin activator domain-containing protein [Halostella sp. PRR32]|uniref:helix-turn-helix domain-containing protein n=1 Tax=Halostella sp. PRR32 TaxID=3098147 RepID=UPI002B1D1AAD|nr:bacterio-opsin activator domain-containing protein [Halostella sp. PRR32]
MPTIAEFSHPSTEFVLGRALQEDPGVTVEVERIVADTTNRVTPFFWARGDGIDEFHDALRTDPSVKDVRRLDDSSEGRFYRAEWDENAEPLVYALDDVGATILDAVGDDGKWHVRILFPDDESLAEFHDLCAAYDLSFELVRLYKADTTSDPAVQHLTDEQREVLELAYDQGYFSVPRETSMEELANELDISTNAISKRLRRAHETVLEETFEGVRGTATDT